MNYLLIHIDELIKKIDKLTSKSLYFIKTKTITINMYPCPGSLRVSDARTWYVPPGKKTSDCTICEECFDKYLKVDPESDLFGVYTDLASCNCDYSTFYENTGLETNGIMITISDAKTGKKYPKLDNNMANLNGVVHFVLPTCTEYVINVKNTGGDYLTFESGFVGENKKIIINDGKKLYYPGNLNIKGFKTGTNESFMFISPSTREKSEGYDAIEGENVSNIIKLKFRRWKREVQTRSSSSRFGDCRFDNDNEGFFGSRGCLSYNTKSLSGGATISGGAYVNNISSSSTSDTFKEIDNETEFVIQLVCDQDESEKYETNKQYYFKRDFEKRKKLLIEKERIESDLNFV